MWVTQTGEQGIDWPQVLLSLPLPLCSLSIRDALILTVSAISAMDGKVMTLPWAPGKERVPPDRLRRQELGARSRPSFSSPLPARLLLPASKTWKSWSLADFFFFSDPTAWICTPSPATHLCPTSPYGVASWVILVFLLQAVPHAIPLSCPPHPPHPHSFPFLLCWQENPPDVRLWGPSLPVSHLHPHLQPQDLQAAWEAWFPLSKDLTCCPLPAMPFSAPWLRWSLLTLLRHGDISPGSLARWTTVIKVTLSQCLGRVGVGYPSALFLAQFHMYGVAIWFTSLCFSLS